MTFAATSNLLRTRGDGHARVGYIELFFDLVFVFAVTQLSHSLLHHLSGPGALQVAMLFMGMWWVWIFTAWVTNWLDPERVPVRLMLMALTGLGLFLSMAIPTAFGTRGLVFAAAYVAMQVGRSCFMLWATRRHDAANHKNFQRITAWFVFSGIFWIVGGLSDGSERLAFWGAALLIEYIAPSAFFWVPGLGRSHSAEWDVEAGHMAERCGLFIIIALGESVLITGATFAELSWTTETFLAFASAFFGTLAMWWLYFNIGAERATHKFEHVDDRGAMARLAYTYMHLPIVAGIIVCAAADELVLAHPGGHTEPTTAAAIIGGVALYLLGNLGFKRATAGWFAPSHVTGLLACGALVFATPYVTPLILSAATTGVLMVVAAWETISLRPQKAAA